MRISCSHCSAEYNVDERRIPDSGLNVRCPKCQGTFPVRRPAPAAAGAAVPLPPPAAARPAPPAAPRAEPKAPPLVPPVASPVPLPAPAPRPFAAAPPAPAADDMPAAQEARPARPMRPIPLGAPAAAPAPPPPEAPPEPLGFGEVSFEEEPPPSAEPAQPVAPPAPATPAAEAAPGRPGAPAPAGEPGAGAGSGPPAPSPAGLGPVEQEELEALFGDGRQAKPDAVAPAAPRPVPRAAPEKKGEFLVRRRSGKVFGPFDSAKILEMLAQGELLGNEEVTSDGGESWESLGAVPSFAETVRRLNEAPAAPEGEAARTGSRPIPPPFTRMAAAKVSATVPRERPRWLRWVPVAAAVLVLLGVGIGAGFTRHGLFFYKTVRGKGGPGRPAARLLAQAREGFAADGFEGYRRALELADQALRLDADDAEAKGVYAQAAGWLQRRGAGGEPMLGRARAATAEIAAHDPKEPDTLKARVAMALAGKPAELAPAVAPLEAYAHRNPRDEDALALLAAAATSRRDWAAAASWIDKAEAARPGTARAGHARGLVALGRGDDKAAREAFEKALEKDPRHVASAVELAAIADRTGDAARAEALLRGALAPPAVAQLAPSERARAHVLLAGLALRAAGSTPEERFQATEKELEEAVRAAPADVATRVAYARFLLRRGDPERAVKVLQPAAGSDDPEFATAQVRALALAGRALDAQNAVDAALAKAPGAERLLFLKGFVLAQLGKSAEAQGFYAQALTRDPNDWEARLAVGRAALRAGDLARAETELQLAAEKGPHEPEAQVGLGELRLAKGDLEGSAAAYREALRLDPESPGAHLGLARLALARKDEATAAAELELAIKLDPRLAEAHAVYGSLLWRRGDLEGAAKAFAAAVALDPRAALPRTRLGAVLLERGQVDAALTELGAATNADAASAEANHWLGRALLAKGENGQAVERLRRAVDLDPSNALSQLYLGIAQERVGSLPEAFEAYRAAVARDPRLVEGYERIGSLHAAQGACKEAVPLFEKALAVSPGLQRVRVQLADCKEKLGRPAEAVQLYRQALQADPRLVGLYYKIARAIHLSSGPKAALPWYERAAQVDRDNPMPHYYLGYAFKERGQKARAIQEFRAYLKARPDAEDRKDIEQEIEDLGG